MVITGRKTWNHGSNPEAQRPTHIAVQLYGDGELILTYLVDADSHWQYSFTVPKYGVDGREVVYTVDETSVEGYRKRVVGYDLYNTHSSVPGPDEDPPDSPGTGDLTDVQLWLCIMLFSALALILMALGLAVRRYQAEK